MGRANTFQVNRRIERILNDTRRATKRLRGMRALGVLAVMLPFIYVTASVQIAPAQGPRSSVIIGTTQQPSVYVEALAEANRLTAAEVEALESEVARNPENLDARGKLIAYYYLNAKPLERSRHALWVIEHHPESDLAGAQQTGFSRWAPISSEADFARARQLWIDQGSRSDADPRVLANAATFFTWSGDYLLAERALETVHGRLPNEPMWAARLAHLYTLAINIAAATDQQSFGRDAQVFAFAERAKHELLTTRDAQVVMQAISALQMQSQAIRGGATAGAPGGGELQDFVQRLTQHAENDLGLTPLAAIVQSSAGPAPTYVPNPVSTPDPEYPPLAKQARIQGVVRFDVVIGADGRVKNPRLVNGHPLLVAPAREALEKWTFEPPVQNGVPMEMPARLDVRFRLPVQTMKVVGQPTPPKQIRVGGQVQAIKLVKQPKAVYPPLALQARIQGTVRFSVVIGTEGDVKTLQLVSGHPLLVPAAQEAAQQYVYQQTLLNGEPVEVVTTLDVNFVLE